MKKRPYDSGGALPSPAFTLIELLVVITIIVVLLALLMPSLDKAIYEAEMAVDLANVRGIGTAANVYAMDYKRTYPYREDAQGSDTSASTGRVDTGVDGVGSVGGGAKVGPYQYSSPNNIRDARGGMTYDMRARMRSYWSVKQAAGCPFSTEVDLEDGGSLNNTLISSDYALFFGWKYGSGRGMIKVGDKFSYSGRQFSVIAGDVDVYDPTNVLSWASHPDDFQLGEMVWQNYGDPQRDQARPDAAAYGTLVGDSSFSWTWSRWDCRAVGTTSQPEWWRAPLDNNYAFTDGSAKRYDDVKLDVGLQEPTDERMGRAAFYRDGGPRLILPLR